jgi:ribonuclease HIII
MTQSSSPFVTQLETLKGDQLLQDLKAQYFAITYPVHTRFSAQKKGVSCTLYTSGKLVVQGKEAAEFIEFYLEPKILGTFNYTNPLATLNLTPRIGIDESGKGDFFGPLCVAGVYVRTEDFAALQAIGVKDSKLLTDTMIRKQALLIQKQCMVQIVKINPPKYNEIYADFKNLNSLLAWGHATTIEKLVERSGCKEVIIDQFANERVVEQALKRKKLTVDLTQRHRGEEDLAVAAASILARYAFIDGLDKLGQTLQMELPKGSSQAVQKAGRSILVNWGEETLRNICKQHFKTLDLILGKERR